MPLKHLKVYFIFILMLYSKIISATPILTGESLPDLYERLMPSVVVINISKSNQLTRVNEKGQAIIQNIDTNGEGSGVLISNKLVLTAAHVVHGVDKLEVTFADGQVIPAKVISSDVNADLSLVELKYKYPAFKTIIFGDSDKTRIGEPIFVIGAPYNISYTLTRGIISGRHQEGSEADFYKSEFFQTDAALNPGNSGGPLFNMRGELIAIASFIKSKSGGNEGLGFAVTMNSIKKLILEKPPFYSGIDSHLVDGILAKALNIAQNSAILVTKVAQGTMADKIGLKGGSLPISYHNEKISIGGDIILSINDIPTDSQLNLKKIQRILSQFGNQGKFKITILREGLRQTLVWKGLTK